MSSPNIPEMGTPEFRQFVQTEEWMNYRHELALQEDEAWTRQQHNGYFDHRIIPGLEGVPSRFFARDWRQNYPIDHPRRMEYEEEIHGMSPQELDEIDRLKAELITRASLRVPLSSLVDRPKL